jgi:hypothetical protein
MPRPRFSYRQVYDTFTIPAGAVVYKEIDLVDSFYPQLLVIADYPATSNPAGVTCVILPTFMVDSAGTRVKSDNGNTVSEMQAPTLSSGTPQTKRSAFAVNPEIYPRFVTLRFTNTDTTNAVTLRIVGDW